MDFPDHPFWNFSVTAHRQPGVHEACLALQRRYAVDVNLLFFCCWVGAAGGGQLDSKQIHHALDTVAGWQEEIVRPIWKARWRLKPSFQNFPTEKTEALRRYLIQAELDAEHIEQLHLANSVVFATHSNLSDEEKAAHGIANIISYLDAFAKSNIGTALDKADMIGLLTVIVAAGFPGMDRSRLKFLMENKWR